MTNSLFTFLGRIYPERYDWTFEPPQQWETHVQMPGRTDLLILRMTVSVSASQVTAVVETENSVNETDLRQTVRVAVQMVVDILGFIHSAALSVELHTSIDPTGVTRVWNSAFDGLDDDQPWDMTREEMAGLLIRSVSKRPMVAPLAFREFSRAIEASGDTPLHCYRSIEAIRQHFVPAGDLDEKQARRVSWEALRAALNVNLDDLRWLESYAVPSRHGDLPRSLLNAADRARALRIARRAIVAFASLD